MFTPVRVLSHNGPVRVELAHWRNRLVVVKRLQGVSEVFAQRLEREAAVLRKLRHQNIIPLLATEGTALIYAYAPGVSLLELMQQHSQTAAADAHSVATLPLAHCSHVVNSVLRALEYSHQRGILHLDIKPSNIIMQGDKVLLNDFGFAKDLHLASITQHNTRLGTPNYMAPEQFYGRRDDPRSDIYALGATLYHMLTGRPPYGDKVMYFLAGDSTLERDPLPAEAQGLQALIDTALARHPEQRFHSACAMRRALQDILEPA